MKTRIIIAGIGGVGGYFGGHLAKEYHNSDEIEICFFARGENLAEIKKNGLKVIEGEKEFTAKPKVISNDPNEIGIADLIIICSKSHNIETIVQQLKPCISKETMILPLLNGVDSRDKIQKILPENIILDGCVYIISRLKEPGVVENLGNIQTLYFGVDHFTSKRLELFETIFKNANIQATLSQNISSVIWEKFIFISSTATATSYFDNSFGELISEGHLDTVTQLITEIKQIADAKNIVTSDDIAEKIIKNLKSLPFETTSSMHSDFRSRFAPNELDTLTTYVLNEGERLGIETPNYLKAYEKLKSNTNV